MTGEVVLLPIPFAGNGMILFAEDRDGALKPVVPHGEPGAVVR